jgi:four helix bundle protein
MGRAPQDIQKRIFDFGVRVIELVNCMPRTLSGEILARQLIRSGVSVGANVQEADGAESKKDFIHKMSIAYKESRESRHWLATIRATELKEDTQVSTLWQEADELVRILFTIIKNARQSPNRPSHMK